MPLDHAKANVTISVVGIALCSINSEKRNRCEIDIIRCERHKPVLDIQKITLVPDNLDPDKRKPSCSSVIPHSLNLDQDISINVAHSKTDGSPPCERGTSIYTHREFDRLDDTGDDEDFRWVPNLEGPEFHDRKLKIKNKSKLKPTIFISDGILYTRQKTEELFARVSVKGKSLPVALGKFAYGINLDITELNGGEVILSNRYKGEPSEPDPRCSVRLPQNDCIKYLITIENHCQLPADSEGTDFRLFYEVLKVPEKKQFDLRRIVETGCYGEPEEALKDHSNYSLDGYPQSCMAAALGR
jgi:hypothetical protein